MTGLMIEAVSVLADNYVHLAHDPASGETAAVDPAEAGPVLDAVKAWGWRLSHVLITHHHGDHIGGVREVKAATGCTVIGARADAHRIPALDLKVGDGDVFFLGARRGRVVAVPGHTSGHVAYWFEDDRALFCGDALFSLGCGRVFEGTMAEMWTSLLTLRRLPDDTRVYCAHEYTNANADFALTVDPENPALRDRAAQVLALRESGRPTVPSLLGEEKAANPFLRADQPAVAAAVGLAGRPPTEVFAEIRHRKDRF